MSTMIDSGAPHSSGHIDTIPTIPPDATLAVPVGSLTLGATVALVQESGPHSFRLARKPDGELVLQGAFERTQGFARHTIVWRDQETVAWEPAA